jgi:cobalamin biosynthesis protein CobD/CbiB
MIERNLGNIERILRVFLAIGLVAWLALQGDVSGVDWFVLAAALMLMLNGIFSRCYLWYVLDLDTRGEHARQPACRP